MGWMMYSSWRPGFWSLYSINHYIHSIHYSCILSTRNKPFLRDIYILIKKMSFGVSMTVCWMIWYCNSFLYVFKCIFSCIVQDSLYHIMDKGTMWYCALVSCTQSQSIELLLGVRCSGVECDVSAPEYSLRIWDWTCYLRTHFSHV